ncbi:TIGR03986 family type III CRISPR-associated RAMP protein [Algivirga pacifica]|uniref:CRISPR-associated protein n=1 Tax=Algivirga pacifica TaxID=1162670 RepID=A0ABP9D4S0_9BACT
MPVKSTYNFVPLSKEVFFPEWADMISHDLPFSDAESGTIRLKIKALSDIFVRNAALKGEAEQKDLFHQHKDKYFIPGSSIKGEVATTLQILSFSKINPLQDVRYSVRDLQNVEVYRQKMSDYKIRGGWLKLEHGKYMLKDAGEPGRISHGELDAKFGTNMAPLFKGKVSGYQGNKDEHKAAAFKYKMFKGDELNQPYVFRFDREDVMREIYEFGVEGAGEKLKKGKLVFTGQPSKRKEPSAQEKAKNPRLKASGKVYEFIFWETNAYPIEVPMNVIDDFHFTYYEHDKAKWTVDYKHWRQALSRGENIPVFYAVDNKGKILHLGISYMYKLPYDYRVAELLPEQHKSERLDLAQCMFGYTHERKDKTIDALKGRVQFGHAFATEETAHANVEQKVVLSSPRASYYPFYIEQGKGEKTTKYTTYHDHNATIRGYKRYPFRKDYLVNRAEVLNEGGRATEKMDTKFVPLKSGVEFVCDINLHGLRKVEIGALLSALTMHGNEDKYFHGLGMAKPLGYGRCSYEIEGLAGLKATKEEYLAAFEEMMVEKVSNWHSNPSVRELLAMSVVAERQDSLAYPKLKDNNGHNFVKYKKDRLVLPSYSEITQQKDLALTSITSESTNKGDAVIENVRKEMLAISDYRKELEDEFSEAYLEVYRELSAELKTKASEKEKEENKQRAAERKSNAKLEVEPPYKDFKKHVGNKVDLYLRQLHGRNYKKELTPPCLSSEEADIVEAALREGLGNARFLKTINKKEVILWLGDTRADELLS